MDPEKPFGERLYDVMRERGLHVILTNRMNYEQIQELKLADREACAKLFRGSSYVMVQRIKNDEPEKIAEFLAFEQLRAQAATTAVVFMGMGII